MTKRSSGPRQMMMGNEGSQEISKEEQYTESAYKPLWGTIVELFRDDVENWGGDVQMLRLVEYLADQRYIGSFFPSTQLMRLGISTKPWPEWNRTGFLSICWDKPQQVFHLDYSKNAYSKSEDRTCQESEVHDMVELKLLRLWLSASGSAS